MTEIEALKLTMDYFQVSRKEINSKSRKRAIADCRAVLCWWYIEVMKLSQTQASLRFLRTTGFSRDNYKKVERLKKYFALIILKLETKFQDELEADLLKHRKENVHLFGKFKS